MNDLPANTRFAAIDDSSPLIAAPPRPILRGTFHLAAALAAPFGLVLLVLIADSPRAYVGASIFAASMIALYTSSASYHLVPWPQTLRDVMKRLDHSMIFALIAGTYTPFCLIVLGNAWGITMLCVVWTLAGLGMLLKIAWPYAPRWLSVGLYLALGWIGIIAVGEVITSLSIAELSLLMLGGALYSIGAIIYAMKWPDPSPRIFGFHEIFHLFVVAGSLVHFALLAIFILPD
ncbi:MAG TPA: hemolysin III family protein [Dehalococcoidia bacterium]